MRASTDEELTVEELFVIIDDLWGCIGQPEIDDLQPETIEKAKLIHQKLWHS